MEEHDDRLFHLVELCDMDNLIMGETLASYNRASGVAVCACVWQPTPRTADVTVTKIAGYVRVRILMNR